MAKIPKRQFVQPNYKDELNKAQDFLRTFSDNSIIDDHPVHKRLKYMIELVPYPPPSASKKLPTANPSASTSSSKTSKRSTRTSGSGCKKSEPTPSPTKSSSITPRTSCCPSPTAITLSMRTPSTTKSTASAK